MRDGKGRFLPGVSGNPQGRPQGSFTRLARTLQKAAAEILPQWIEAALSGDEEKQKFILERGLPRFKAQTADAVIDVKGNSNVHRIRALFDAAVGGELSPSTAAELVSVLAAAARVEEIEELKSELEAVKLALSRRKHGGGE